MKPDESGPDRAAMLDSLFTRRRFALLLGLLVGACFAPVLLGFQSFVYRDFGLFGHPLAYYYHQSFWRGEIPLWNPLNNCGLPFMAQWNTMVFYPPSLIYLLLPLPWSLNLFCLLHLWFGGLGMYCLARRWTNSNFAAAFAGIVFSFNGLALHCLMWPNNIAALGWMPWVWLLVERAWAQGGRSLVPAMLAGACQFMAGAPEAFLLTWIGAAVVWLATVDANRAQFGRLFVRFAGVVAGVIALSAVQLLPLLELMKESQRTSGYDTGRWAMPAWGWANLLVPLFRTMSNSTGDVFQIGQFWTSSYYFGVVTLWLALIAMVRPRNQRVWALACLVIISLVLALGNAGFIWPLLKHYVGALGFIRFPVKLVFLVTVPLILLAALGFAELLRPRTSTGAGEFPPPQNCLRLYGGLAALLLVGIATVLWFDWRHPLDTPNMFSPYGNGTARAAFFIILVAGALTLKKISGRRTLIAGSVWLLLVLSDFLSHVPWQNPTADSAFLAPGTEALQSLRQSAVPGQSRAMLSLAALDYFHQVPATNLSERYLANRLGQLENLNLLEGVAKVDGFYSLYLSSLQKLQYRVFPDENSVHPAVADVMAVGWMTAPGKLFEWSARSNALPMVSAGQQPVFVSDDHSLNTILYSNFNPRTSVLLPPGAQSATTATRQPEATATVEKFQAQAINIKVITPGPTMVSISQSYYPPWKAYLDDKPIQLWRANHAFQAVSIPSGEHRVRLRYEDKMFHAGAAISGTSLVLMLGLLACQRKRATEQSSPN